MSDTVYGCSECLCITIESHRSALLLELLQRPGVAYRDIFWAPMPESEWDWLRVESLEYIHLTEQAQRPDLHRVTNNSDLSFVGTGDCGHDHFDFDICTPVPMVATNRILVSIPMMARWNTCKGFDAEGMLRDSGKFD